MLSLKKEQSHIDLANLVYNMLYAMHYQSPTKTENTYLYCIAKKVAWNYYKYWLFHSCFSTTKVKYVCQIHFYAIKIDPDQYCKTLIHHLLKAWNFSLYHQT